MIVYSLGKLENFDFFIPLAYVCDVDPNGQPKFIQANAQFDTIASYGIEISNKPHQVLLEICHELKPLELEKTLNKNRKKHEKLSVLFSDPKIKSTIQSIIDKKMVKFLDVVHQNGYFFCDQLKRKIWAKDVLLTFLPNEAVPKLKFRKTQTGVTYYLKLQIEDELITPHYNDIELISNDPAYIRVKKFIVKVTSINSTKIRPFLKNESIYVPQKLVKSFFSQFVTDVMGKIDIEAEGFEIIKHINITKRNIFFIFDIFEDKWMAVIKFTYDDFKFLSSDPGKRKTKINFSENGEIIVDEATRSFNEENKSYDLLISLGLTNTYNNRFVYGDNKFDIFEKITKEYASLENEFEIELPDVDGKLIQLTKWVHKPNFRLVNDWFDLYGVIQIGDEQYSFTSLFKNIREDNRFFKLKNGRFTIIPQEIMTKYSQIATFASEHSGNYRLAKSHFVLLDENDMDKGRKKTSTLMDNKDIEYKTSPLLKAELRPYQIEGVKWLIKHRKNGLGACLADDMGLGKTLQTIAALIDAKEHKPSNLSPSTSLPVQLDLFGELNNMGRKSLNALIILPASLVFNWYNELRNFAPSLQVIQYQGPSRHSNKSTLMTFDVVLTTYQTLVADIEIFEPLNFHYIVLDESQQIRNKNSKTFQAVHRLSSDHRLSLSGTPIENSLSDLWSQMEFINPSVLGKFTFFKEQFLLPIEKNKDTEAIKKLKKMVDPYILRRTKEQVAPDLPELIEGVHYSEMPAEQTRIYQQEKSAARNYLAGLDKEATQYRFHVLSSILKLRQIANHPGLTNPDYLGDSGKFEDVVNHINTIVKANHKLLIFSSFVSHLEMYEKWLQSQQMLFVKLTGSSSQEDRKYAVDKFQNDPEILVFLLSIKAGGTGLNLTAADYVFILDPWWNPFVEKQAVARAHRIGRSNSVIVKRFISKDTIEEKILSLQTNKKVLSDDILEINDLQELSNNELEDLI